MHLRLLTAYITVALVTVINNPALATEAMDTRNAIKACKQLEKFASRTANDRFVKEIPLSDALLEVAGDPTREAIVLEAYTKGPREIGNGGRGFGEHVFRRCYAGANSPDDGRTTQEILAENKKMKHQALSHWAMAVQKKLRDNWKRPDDASVGWTCTATIWMKESGEVKTIKIERCDGTSSFKDSVRSAIESSSPLPRPAISSIWQEKIRLNFKPE
ncbi:TonB C-terminal domain-containing protein [Guyparkeria sp. SCN-R1]|uniref:TonB C-terminal domain-containing protein n=1 Tax=Guyparkeria sp. SCN-R1 TaxID=2341113 RepID=UPI000F64BBA1|nr:TonB C-terminal domain-containing protein [Guyparkeria sp. SCN-R1]RRQ24516.1 TonB C-terminal domain-containing protein [Guyparkeria sp. SCN-R1]